MREEKLLFSGLLLTGKPEFSTYLKEVLPVLAGLLFYYYSVFPWKIIIRPVLHPLFFTASNPIFAAYCIGNPPDNYYLYQTLPN
jgi:hypothetical protein